MPYLRNKQHELFARAVVSGLNLTDSHVKAVGGVKNKRSKFNGCTWRKRPDIDSRIQELIEQQVEKEAPGDVMNIPLATKVGEEQQYRSITRERALQMLHDILEMSPESASLSSPLCDLKFVGKMAMPVAVPPDRLRALERVSKMNGWDKETLEIKANERIVSLTDEFVD